MYIYVNIYIYKPGIKKPKTSQDPDHGFPSPQGPYVCTCACVDMRTCTDAT